MTIPNRRDFINFTVSSSCRMFLIALFVLILQLSPYFTDPCLFLSNTEFSSMIIVQACDPWVILKHYIALIFCFGTHTHLYSLVNSKILKQMGFCWWPLLSTLSLDHFRLYLKSIITVKFALSRYYILLIIFNNIHPEVRAGIERSGVRIPLEAVEFPFIQNLSGRLRFPPSLTFNGYRYFFRGGSAAVAWRCHIPPSSADV